MGKPKKTGTTLSKRAHAILARTKASRAELDAKLVGFVDKDLTPVMVETGPAREVLTDEQPEESEEMAVVPTEREERARKISKARQKRSDNAKARRTLEQKVDAALDDYMAHGAAVAREVTESLKPVMGIPASARGLVIR